MLYSLGDTQVQVPVSGNWWVAPGAAVIGRVTLGENASVWFNAVVRGDTDAITIGAGSNIQDGAVLHADPGFPLVIGGECTIGHLAMVHGCTIGDGALIGIGATVLNGAVVGEGSLIGARALVGEGKTIPPHSLVVGIPGRVVRTLDEAEVARLRRTAEGYQRKWRRFKESLGQQEV